MLSFNKFLRILNLRGQTLKDEFWINLAKCFFIPKRIFTKSTSMGSFLLKDSIAKTNYGLFFCRRKTTDLGFISESFESEIVDVFKRVNGTVVDCGAHIGKYTILSSKIVGKRGKVIAIEPDPENYKVLIKNIALNKRKNITPLNCAVWKETKKLKLFITDTTTQHFTGNTDSNRHYERAIEVDAIKLDDLFRKAKIKKIDWLKLDVEGAEAEVLAGARKALKAHKISNIIIELHMPVLGRAGAKKLLAFLEKNKYSVKHISGNYYLATAV